MNYDDLTRKFLPILPFENYIKNRVIFKNFSLKTDNCVYITKYTLKDKLGLPLPFPIKTIDCYILETKFVLERIETEGVTKPT